MLGRVLTVQGKQLYLAPCCGTVQEYRGTGQEFIPLPCPHAVARAGQGASHKKRPKHTCSAWHCQAQALPRQHRVVDHLDGCMETIYLCYKHTPPEEWLRRAKNFAQFNKACREWEIKCKPAHRK